MKVVLFLCYNVYKKLGVILMLIKTYLSNKAYIRYEQILKEINKPIEFSMSSINEIKAYGFCGNFGDRYKVWVASEIKDQDDIDHNFLHECLHLKQIKKGIPDVIPLKKYENAKGVKEFAILLNATFMDIPVEATLKKWGFRNKGVIKARLNNLINSLKAYDEKYDCNNDFMECMLSISYALYFITYDKEDIISVDRIIKNYNKIINNGKEIVKILKKVDFNNCNSIKDGMQKVIRLLKVQDKVEVVSRRKNS